MRSVSDRAPAMQLCAAGYSGWFGVASRGTQARSTVVASLPSVSASVTALKGRQNWKKYFDSKQAFWASACATHIIAIKRACSARLRFVIAKLRKLRGQYAFDASALKSATAVCSVVRAPLVAEPSDFVSLRSAAYAVLTSA